MPRGERARPRFSESGSSTFETKGFLSSDSTHGRATFSGDPLVALSTELTDGLTEFKDNSLETKITETKKLAKDVLVQSIPGLVRLAAASIPYASLLGDAAAQVLTSCADNEVTGYQKAKDSVEKFRAALEDMAETLSKASDNRPLIVMIDELDRCRPSYAVELLEVAKHLFAVDRIVFVLAVNRSQLAHSIKAVYGSSFDAVGYLRRFFDVDFRLPSPVRDQFIDAQLDAIQINDYFKRTSDKNVFSDNEEEAVRNLLKVFFGAHDLGLRQIAQAIHRLGLVYASLPSNQRSFAITAAVLLIVRTIDPTLYLKFRRRQVSDVDVVDRIVGGAVVRGLEHQFESPLFEAMMVIAFREDEIARMSQSEHFDSPLLQRYQELLAARKSDNALLSPDQKRAQEVINRVRRFRQYDGVTRFGFWPSARRLELLSIELIDDQSAMLRAFRENMTRSSSPDFF